MARGDISSVASVKGVIFLAAAFTFLLSALFCSLPGERVLLQRSDTSADSVLNDRAKTRVKKSMNNLNLCTIQTPSAEDLERLRLTKRENGSENHMYDNIYKQAPVSCTLKTDCDGSTIMSVKCTSDVCSKFDVKRESSELLLQDVTLHTLEGIVGLQGSSQMRLKLLCREGKTDMSEAKWEIIKIRHLRKHTCKSDVKKPRTPPRVHVITTRFLSRWEVYARLKRLTELVTSNAFEGIHVLDFPRYQSLAWQDIDNLALLLQGNFFSEESKYTILDSLKDKGFNVRIFDLSEEDYQRSLNLKRITKGGQFECLTVPEGQSSIFDGIPSCNCSIYQGSEQQPEEKLAHLTTCLSNVNVMDDKKGLFTLTFLENTGWDRTLEQTVDVAITNIVKNIVSSENDAIVLVLSDVGNTLFSHLDNSLFLQTQSSNPFFFIFYPSVSEMGDKYSTLAENRNKLISLRDIHVTISDLLSSDAEIDSKSKYPRAADQYHGLSLLRSRLPYRQSTDVQPPNLGICETGSVVYPNDSIQVGYAETAVGLINNYIQNKMKLGNRKVKELDNRMMEDHSKCLPIVGERFFKLRKFYKDGCSMTVMDLEIRVVKSNVIKLLTGIVIKVPVSQNDNQTLSLESNTEDIGTVLEREIFPLVCAQIMDVNISLIARHQIPMLLGRARSFGTKPRVVALHGECLLLVVHAFKDSASYYVMNICDDRVYDFTFSGQLINVFSLSHLPVTMTLSPGQGYFITSLVKSSYFVKEHSFHYETYYDMVFI